RGHRQLVIVLLQLAPTAREQPPHPVDRRTDAKPSGGIERACPIEAILKGAVTRPRRVVPVTNNGGLNLGLLILAHPQETCAFGRADPFVRISGVISRDREGGRFASPTVEERSLQARACERQEGQ